MSAGRTRAVIDELRWTAGDLAPAAGDVDGLAVATLRLLAADMVQSAGSGHPGLPMGCAPLAWTLWSRHLRHDPADPQWADRDRFVLSAGHGSALLYGLLHLFGYGVSIDDLRAFRQLDSRTPGHPEHGETPGVETTTGPLGQGLANAVGMALAERMLHARFGSMVGHHTYVLAGDGCLMEGISHEAASLAGHLGLGRLIAFYDDNQITIDGAAGQSCSDDSIQRFAAYGWHTSTIADGNDMEAIDRAIRAAKADPRPSLIAIRTVIGFGAPGVEGRSQAHGAPLGPEVLTATRSRFGFPDNDFHVPAEVSQRVREIASDGARRHADWQRGLAEWTQYDPRAATEFSRALCGELPLGLADALERVPTGERIATRQASARVLAAVGSVVPELVGGSADLAGSTGTDTLPGGSVGRGDYSARTVHFGIREHAMAAVLNGVALHGGFRTFGSTFLVFSDYLRPALRLSALMGLPVIYVLSHDSVAVGEDGPTHQPVEQVESLRLIPGLAVLRPADDAETVAAWQIALERTDGPTALILSRQALPPWGPVDGAAIRARGARVVGSAIRRPEVTILATGSEVALAVAAAGRLAEDGIAVRTVSVPWRERLLGLTAAERADFLGSPALTVAVEAGVPHGWAELTGSLDRVLGVTTFGASGPGEQVQARLGLTVDGVVTMVRNGLADVAAGQGSGRRTGEAGGDA